MRNHLALVFMIFGFNKAFKWSVVSDVSAARIL